MSTPPKRVSLAHLPTPLEPLHRLSAELGARLSVKRDDLTGSHLTGNKIRKLEYLFAEALSQNATHVITCGALQSNHCRATAMAAAPLGLTPYLLLRTANGVPEDVPSPPAGNYLLDLLAGANVRLCDPPSYRDRTRVMAQMADKVRASGGRPYVIPEGGSNAVGALGYVAAAHELADQLEAPPTSLVVATGSGGTLAGLALGLAELGWPTTAVGIAVCDDEATFRGIVDEIAAEASKRFDLPVLSPDSYEVIDGFQGRGYGLSTMPELQLLRDTARRDGLLLDPVYTGKAFGACLKLMRQRDARLGDDVVFAHTGGAFGLLGAAEALAQVL